MPEAGKFSATVCALVVVCVGIATAGNPKSAPALRWEEGTPGCTFSADDDGRYRYGMWTSDFGIVLAVDSQELQKSRRRSEPVFAVLLTIRFRGKTSLALDPGQSTLEFVNHFHDVHRALDPTPLAARFQSDADHLAEKTAREIQRHPEKKASLESELQENRQNAAEMLAFLASRSLHALTLDSAHTEASGWIYFSARSKWIGEWEKQEEFVLRIPLEDQTLEFPFALPPSEDDLLLRRR